jgi:hypothetical protein
LQCLSAIDLADLLLRFRARSVLGEKGGRFDQPAPYLRGTPDNGSTDGSQALAEANGARVVAIPEHGYGSALNGGIRAALGKYVIMADSDDSYVDLLTEQRMRHRVEEAGDLDVVIEPNPGEARSAAAA